MTVKLILALALAVTACGGGSSASPDIAALQRVLDAPAPITLQPGQAITITAADLPTPPPCGTLPGRIDAAAAGSILDLTGCTYTAGATITKPLTILGATITPPPGTTGLVVSADDVTLDGLHIIGPQATVYQGSEYGINVAATAVAPVRRLTIRNSEIANFGKAGLWLRFVSDLVIEDNHVHDVVYAGVMVLSGVGGRVDGNVVERIGIVAVSATSNNAYGIALSQLLPAQGDAPTSGFIVSGNTVTDVPTWEGLDSHSGQHIVFVGNTVSGCRMGIVISGYSYLRALDNDVNGNMITSPVAAPVNGRHYAVTSTSSTDNQIRNNAFFNWPAGHLYNAPTAGDIANINLTIGVNAVTP